ncbi:MAG: YegS/Rv2252/BmrU family lipid kinase [Wenzhouxiangellaceae bacterium]|nr:YegS/Rv2252/BmrU family lipid kinase [Wenzhouxiangellaceae bacterium]
MLIINPRSGDSDRDADFWLHGLAGAGMEEPRVVDFLDDDWREAIGRDDRILVAGGDGTVSAVAAACAEADATLAVLPSGTANDFARTLGVADDPQIACRAAASGRERSIDVGTVDDHVFVNVVHVGLGAATSGAVDEGAKSDWGQLSYLRTLVEKLGDDRGFEAVIEVDGERIEGQWLEIGVANGAFYGGGHRIPGAEPDDGRLDLFGARPDHAGRLAVEYAKVRLLGPEEVSSEIMEHRRFESCRVTTPEPQPVTADGEDVGRTPVSLSVRAAALRVLVPDGD